jgi:hypothetical protein
MAPRKLSTGIPTARNYAPCVVGQFDCGTVPGGKRIGPSAYSRNAFGLEILAVYGGAGRRPAHDYPVYGAGRFYDGPISECSTGYCSTHHQPHTAAEYRDYKAWEKTILIVWLSVWPPFSFSTAASQRAANDPKTRPRDPSDFKRVYRRTVPARASPGSSACGINQGLSLRSFSKLTHYRPLDSENKKGTMFFLCSPVRRQAC